MKIEFVPVSYRGLPPGCAAVLFVIIGVAWIIGGIVIIDQSFLAIGTTIGTAPWWGGWL